jgi:hypothetical protein
MHPRQAKQQRPAAQPLLIRVSSRAHIFDLIFEDLDKAYCVVLPVSNAVLVMERCPHAGQSAGAGPRLRLAIGVADWYTVPVGCWGGMPG